MVQFNTRANEILLKLVYYGPGLSGKTTNLQALHAMCQDANKAEMFSVNTQEDRTLFFDLLPINLGYIYGNAIHLQIYTVPGQVQYDASRRVVLGGADGVVFVADSSEAKMQDNVDSLSNLYHNLNANRLNIKQIPFVLQYNKRDLPDAMAVGVMNRRLNFRNVPYFEASAYKGIGVLDTFLSITRETVSTTFKKYHLDKKIKDFEEMLALIESNIRGNMHELPQDTTTQQESTILRHSNVSIDDLAPGKAADASELLEDALKSNMETARLYSELKQVKDSLEKKNEEMSQLYTQLDRANQDNLKTRRYLEGLIQSVAEAIVSFSHDGRILTWNASAERIFGYQRQEILSKNLAMLTPPQRAGELEQAIALVSQGQTLRNIKSARLRKDGTEFPASLTYSPVRGADDRVLAFSLLVKDLSEDTSSAEEGSLPALGRLLPSVFNDLANRLNPVMIQARLLEEALAGAPQQRQIQKLAHAVEGVQTLLKPLIMILHPGNPRLEPLDLNPTIQEVLKKVEPEAAAAGVVMDTNLDAAIGICGLDGEAFRAALAGLLRHAVYSAARGQVRRVRIGTRLAGESLQIAVQDTGPLVPEGAQNQAFDLTSAQSIEDLGLPLAGAVVRSHGGRISLRSQEGAGNAVMIELPYIPPAPTPTAPEGLAGKRIVVVDDEPFLLECLVEALQSWKCEVVACATGEEAIRKLQEGSCDLMVSDIRMPGLSGIQLFDWLKANRPGLTRKILYTTGDSFDQDTRAFLEGSGVMHLGKPFDLKKLRQALEALSAS